MTISENKETTFNTNCLEKLLVSHSCLCHTGNISWHFIFMFYTTFFLTWLQLRCPIERLPSSVREYLQPVVQTCEEQHAACCKAGLQTYTARGGKKTLAG